MKLYLSIILYLYFFLGGIEEGFLCAQVVKSRILTIGQDEYQLIFTADLSLKVLNSKTGKIIALSDAYGLLPYDSKKVKFSLKIKRSNESQVTEFGKSNVTILEILDKDRLIISTLTLIVPEEIKNAFIFQYKVKNLTSYEIKLTGTRFLPLITNATNLGGEKPYSFWSFQPESTPERKDWIQPITENYFQINFQGMNAPDYGGGIPLIDLWTKKQGIAIGNLSTHYEHISLPTKSNISGVKIWLIDSTKITLAPNGEYDYSPIALILHKGDYYNALKIFSQLLEKRGFYFSSSRTDNLKTEWCAWGYGRDFTPEQILNSLDEVKNLGFEWVTIDDGWLNAYGDWNISVSKFKNGEKDLIALVDSIHSKGLKVRLWILPLAASDSSYSINKFPERIEEFGMKLQSQLALEHPEWFIQDESGNRIQVSYWNAYSLCPALEEVKNYYIDFVKKAILEWKIDGLKIDGQNINLAPPCFNKNHKHKSPIQSSIKTAEFFKGLYYAAKKLNPDFLIQICPCGTNYSLYNLPYADQVVASDPLNSKQVRIKGKTFKALFGNKIAYSGDHVELTSHRWDEELNRFIVYKDEDFLSTIGIGGVPASKLISPAYNYVDSTLTLTEDKKEKYKFWLNLYNELKLSNGEYLNLYDIAFDKPETHCIIKDNTLYYSFFEDDSYFDGVVEFRGLKEGKLYQIKNEITKEDLGIISSSNPFYKLQFYSSILLSLKEYHGEK